ncbi:KAP family P-loop NTPase fold protein [Sphingobium yanoikuyae]|jgi:hypothetical protein|uniref:KAP family P-loop NTPase fold protein n=1 Tax=Sphingobium yanoikuyae TaxID=13690 RepID=UPI003F0C4120
MTPDEIWNEDTATGRQADLFGRREEAEQLIAYIESVAGRRSIREDKRAYTIAVDAPYGEGKSFFLRRLAEHMKINHPVAYVDAWSDDLADEPLTALAATLKAALEPVASAPGMQAGLANFMSKTGKVAKIVGWGLLRRGAGLVITGKAVGVAEGVLTGTSEAIRDAVDDGLQGVGNGTADDVAAGVKAVTGQALMEARIAAFEEGKQAVQNMKDSLSSIVAALERDRNGNHPPIVIVIDELDRCRPTYSVKLLEEIKYLFDVPGIVFVLALHRDQLRHSISGAYGAGFDGCAYLKRFIDREYRLATPPLAPLLEQLCRNAGLSVQNFVWPSMVISETADLDPTLPDLLAEYMRVYGLSARDAFELVDILQTSVAVANQVRLHLPYLLPLAIGVMKGLSVGELPKPVVETRWVYVPNWSRNVGGMRDATEVGFQQIAKEFQSVMSMSYEERITAKEENKMGYVFNVVVRDPGRGDASSPVWSLYGYQKLLRTVSRFSSPEFENYQKL